MLVLIKRHQNKVHVAYGAVYPLTSQGSHADPCPQPEKCLQWALEHQTMEQWKKVARSDELHFLSYHEGGQVRVHCLPGEEMAPSYTIGRRQVIY